MTNQQLNDVIAQFAVEGKVLSYAPYGDGHINDTYLVETTVRKYILQRINSSIFKNVDALMKNITLVCSHARESIIRAGGDPHREAMTVVPTVDGKSYYKFGEKYFRIYVYIDHTVSLNLPRNERDFYESGVGFGKFAKLLDGFDASQIYDVIPDFHNTVVRYNNFISALNADKLNRAKEVKDEIDFVLKREAVCHKIVDMLASGELKRRVTHNDTKLNNVLLDEKTGKAVAVIDLDTVMQGSVCYDFGDSVRFGCNTAAEDEEDLSKCHFRCRYSRFTRKVPRRDRRNPRRKRNQSMPLGSIMMTLECGIRFLTDYLDGDNYFKVVRTNTILSVPARSSASSKKWSATTTR
ncbi:MAG: phosphotransferase enzyme family protein [Christensenellales bacterium]